MNATMTAIIAARATNNAVLASRMGQGSHPSDVYFVVAQIVLLIVGLAFGIFLIGIDKGWW